MVYDICVILVANGISEGFFKSLNSILSQNFQNYEIIVIDKAKDDSLFYKIDENILVKSNFEYINLEGENSFGKLINTAIFLSRSKYITFLDDNSYWVPETLDTFLKYIKMGSFAVIGKCKTYDVDSKKYVNNNLGFVTRDRYLKDSKNNINLSSCIITKDLFSLIGGFSEKIDKGHDHFFWKKAFSNKEYTIGIIEEVVSHVTLSKSHHDLSTSLQEIRGKEEDKLIDFVGYRDRISIKDEYFSELFNDRKHCLISNPKINLKNTEELDLKNIFKKSQYSLIFLKKLVLKNKFQNIKRNIDSKSKIAILADEKEFNKYKKIIPDTRLLFIDLKEENLNKYLLDPKIGAVVLIENKNIDQSKFLEIFITTYSNNLPLISNYNYPEILNYIQFKEILEIPSIFEDYKKIKFNTELSRKIILRKFTTSAIVNSLIVYLYEKYKFKKIKKNRLSNKCFFKQEMQSEIMDFIPNTEYSQYLKIDLNTLSGVSVFLIPKNNKEGKIFCKISALDKNSGEYKEFISSLNYYQVENGWNNFKFKNTKNLLISELIITITCDNKNWYLAYLDGFTSNSLLMINKKPLKKSLKFKVF